jgi:hypothetical protein
VQSRNLGEIVGAVVLTGLLSTGCANASSPASGAVSSSAEPDVSRTLTNRLDQRARRYQM